MLQYTVPITIIPTFFIELQDKIELIGNSSIIIGGDFNVPLQYDIDTKNYRQNNNVRANEQIMNMLPALDLHDVWRVFHPDAFHFTWHGPYKKQARLDYFLISSDLEPYVTNTKITAAYRSDHSPIELSLHFVNQVRGSGTWKFNNSLLNDEHYANLVRNCIKDTLSKFEVEDSDTDELVYSINPQLLWETIQVMVRGVTISYSSFKKKERISS